MQKIKASRYISYNPFKPCAHAEQLSAELFRETLLVPALMTGDVVEVDVDGLQGFAYSSLEEAFGGLFRFYDGNGEYALDPRPAFKEDAYRRIRFVGSEDYACKVEHLALIYMIDQLERNEEEATDEAS